MSKKYLPLDLHEICNRRFVYDEVPGDDGDYGIEDLIVLKSSYPDSGEIYLNGVPFNYILGANDHIECAAQKIHIGGFIKKLHMVCFAYFGSTYDYLTVKYMDGSVKKEAVLMADWTILPGGISEFLISRTENCAVQKGIKLILDGKSQLICHAHHVIVSFQNPGGIEDILLPDNQMLYVFAVTAEN